MKKSTYKLYKIFFLFIVVFFGSFLAYSSCVLQFMANADDVGEVYRTYLHFGLGIKQYQIFDYLKFDTWKELLVYKIFGIQECSIYISFFIQLFLCNIVTFFISTYFFEDKEKISIALLIAFILLPASNGIRYHLYSTLGMLIVLFAVQRTEKLCRLKRFMVCFLVTLYFIWAANDRALLMLSCLIPWVIYLCILFWRKKENRQYIVGACTIGIIMIALMRILQLGFSIGLPTTFSGYGGASYANWSSIGTAWTEGISIFLDGLLVLWNIPISGGFVQISSILWCIRLALLIIALYAVVENIINLIKGKEIKPCVALASLSVVVVAISYIFNRQIRGATNRDETARYMVIIQYLLVMLLCNKLVSFKKYLPKIEWKKKVLANEYTLIGVAAIFLIVSYSEPVFMGKKYFGDFDDEASREMVEYLQEKGVEYGVGPFWKARQIMYYSGEQAFASCANLHEGKITELVDEKDKCFFYDTDRKCNFIIADKHYQWKMRDEEVLMYHGAPIETKEFVDSADALSAIYIYDYDVRWKPEIYKDVIDCEIPLRLGSSRLVINGTGLTENGIELASEDEFEYSVNLVDNENMVIHVDCMKPINIQISIKDRDCSIETLAKVCEYSAIPMIEDRLYIEKGEQETVNGKVEEGTYKLIIRGEELDKLDISFNEEIVASEINSGEIRRVYLISAEQKENISIILSKNSGKESVVDSIAIIQNEEEQETT